MEIDSARELKQQCFEEIVAPFAAIREHSPRSARDLREFSIAAVPVGRIQMHLPSIALGVAAKRGKQFNLAVRCQRPELIDSQVVAKIRARAKNEVDIRFIGRLRKWQSPRWNQKRVRPVQIGLSCGHYNITAGTLGCFVRPREDKKTLMILSNNHVIADENDAAAGDAILQPGHFDGGKNPKDLVARFAKMVKLEKSEVNYVDCAIATLERRVKVTLKAIKGLGRLAGKSVTFVDVGTEVAKVGRSTDIRRGRVTAIELDNVVVHYDMGDLRFDNQFEIEGAGSESFSQGGDSGSLIVEANSRQALGLLFAGGDAGGKNGKGLTYANPIVAVLDALNVDLA
jgi:hypothetical protein